MSKPKAVDHESWLKARQELMQKEKEFTRLRDEITQQRQALPWELVEKNYHFETENCRQSLAELFGDCSQLIVYHFMFGPDWEAGCKHCSMFADGYDQTAIHLRNRDVAMITVSRAPLDKLLAYKKRMGWEINWASSENSDFNYDYQVSFTQEALDSGEVYYNYRKTAFPASEAPGISVFFKDDDGKIYHTYSAYARGLDMLIGTYNLLDLAPKGRDEQELPFSMAWIQRHDEYDQ